MYCFCVGSKFSSHNSHKICTTTCSDHFMGIQYIWLPWKPQLMCTPHTHIYRIQNKKSIIFSYLCMCICVKACLLQTYMYTGAHRHKEGKSHPLELELQVLVSLSDVFAKPYSGDMLQHQILLSINLSLQFSEFYLLQLQSNILILVTFIIIYYLVIAAVSQIQT